MLQYLLKVYYAWGTIVRIWQWLFCLTFAVFLYEKCYHYSNLKGEETRKKNLSNLPNVKSRDLILEYLPPEGTDFIVLSHPVPGTCHLSFQGLAFV